MPAKRADVSGMTQLLALALALPLGPILVRVFSAEGAPGRRIRQYTDSRVMRGPI